MEDLEMSNEFITQEIDAGLGIVELMSGTKEGKDYWAYMVMRPSKYADYHLLAMSGQEIILEEFGEIVEEGFGLEPPLEIQQKMSFYENSPELNKVIEDLGWEIIKMNENGELLNG